MCCHFVYVVCIAILCMLYVLPFYDARACVTGHFFFPRARTWWMLFDFISFHCAHTLACRACMPYRVSACAYTHTLSLSHTHTHTCTLNMRTHACPSWKLRLSANFLKKQKGHIQRHRARDTHSQTHTHMRMPEQECITVCARIHTHTYL
jgi:hypothetical protein